jgi:hypothetical protein
MRSKLVEWIDNASYEELLTKYRFAPLGDPLFIGAMGEYFFEVMERKKPSPEEHTLISKRIGWD